MKVTVAKSKREKRATEPVRELVGWNCWGELSRIGANPAHTQTLILELMSGSGIPYSIELGCFCAHVGHHFHPDRTKVERSDLTAAHRLTLQFPLIFKPNQPNTMGLKCQAFPTTNHMLVYAKRCVITYLPPELINAITDRQVFSLQLIGVIKKLLGSLFLEFIPLRHSQLLFRILLGEQEDEEKRQWMLSMREKMEQLYPYYHLLQILCSLTYHISQGRKAVSIEHFMELLSRPVMGLVEWPLIIGTRVQFELPPLQ